MQNDGGEYRSLLGADLCVSFSGNATCVHGRKAGRLCVRCTGIRRGCRMHFQIDHASRNEVRERVVAAMRDQIIAFLKEERETDNG
ncbi:MAG: hypothetical protein ACLVJX_10135 [Merdibacter sp.]